MGNSRVLDGDRGYRYAVDSAPETSGISLQLFTAFGFATLYALHFLIRRLDLAILSPFEIVWNVLVYLIPLRLIAILARLTNVKEAEVEVEVASEKSPSQRLAMKSEAMRHLLRINSAAPLAQLGISGVKSVKTQTPPVKAQSEIPPGLGNWDNSCYQNSILQSLAALPSLVKFLDKSITSFSHPTGTTTDALHALTQSLSTSSENGKRIWTPAKLKSMSSWQQQDAQEYYSRILDDVEKELRSVTLQNVGTSGLKNLEQTLQGRLSAQPNSQDSPLKTSSIPLEGLLGQRVACVACGYSEGLSLLPFNCLTVSLGSRQRYSLEELLNDYTKLESIEGVECLSCTFQRHGKRLGALLNPTGSDSSSPSHDEFDSVSASKPTLPPAVQEQIATRFKDVQEAIQNEEFSDKLATKCAIGKDARVSSVKTKQVVVARAPQSLAIHVNRSIFDENTGAMAKNLAYIGFPKLLSLRPWILGRKSQDRQETEVWPYAPETSMAPQKLEPFGSEAPQYQLKAVVTHFGRHENGHYICYRQHNSDECPVKPNSNDTTEEQWWRLSDDNVTKATEEEVLHQGGVFMLFYEKVQCLESQPPTKVIGTATDSTVTDILEEKALSMLETTPAEDETINNDNDMEANKKTSPSIVPEIAKPDDLFSPESKNSPPQLARSLPQLEQTTTSPQRLRTSRAKRGKTKGHLTPSRQIVTAQ
ncbi:cysteine proteinase [Myriangium duriaei CBS 260.36]|uniref:ubiquitinyl hydrolase 1 n=1 Tax=Myriangium duriaei CBS 260.36 TaxID=1168546 RepID=A0A9P4MRJ6_9PEZI|nr:cysteine proteinase [Myriangium duriaei CBS 260.36]